MNNRKRIIAAVRDDDEFETALLSGADTVFFLYPDIAELTYAAQKAHKRGKRILIHIDLTTGLGKDKSGIEFAKNAGIDGIISTRASLIKAAKECGMQTVQRFFIVDSKSIDTTVETLKSSKADMIEVMPGIAPKIIQKLRQRTDTPIIAGGLIESKEEIEAAISSGAYAISTGCTALWD
ncbi:MAG: glycerol-3-phosphate responsive antiterminator [Clostridia bacterium]